MKKGVNIFAIAAIVLGVIVVAIVLMLVLRKPAQANSAGGVGQMELGYSALHLETIDQFSAFAKEGKYECHLGEDNSGGSIYHVSMLGQEAVVTYYFDAQGNTTDFEAFYYLNAKTVTFDNIELVEMTQEELGALCTDTVGKFCMMLDFGGVADVYLTNQDGTFTLVESDEDYQSVIDGSAYLSFTIRDRDGYLWELVLSDNEGLLMANVSKYFNVAETKDYIANISLYEEG